MGVRQKKQVQDKLIQDFEKHKLGKNTSYLEYNKVAMNAIHPRAIRKIYGSWVRAVRAIQIARPDLFKEAQPAIVKPEPKAVVKPEPEKVEQTGDKKEPQVSPKPMAKPVKKPTVSTSK